MGAPADEPDSGDPQVQLRLTNGGKHRNVTIPAPKDAYGFGAAVASVSSHEGDGDPSTCAQLAVGAPRANVDGKPGAGAVYLYKWDGSRMALRAKYTQGSNGVPGTPQQDARFGASLASAPLSDSSGNNAIPLYVGAPGQNVGYITDAGTITELTIPDTDGGHADGVTLDLGSPGVPGEPSLDGRLGASLAAAGGVVTAGSPGHRIHEGMQAGPGAVLTFIGSAGKLTSPQLLTQATDGVVGNPESGDDFGTSVSSVALGGPGSPVETLVGIPNESIGTVPYAGAVLRFRTDPATGRTGSFHGYQQGSEGVGGSPEDNDRFGLSVSIDKQDGGAPLRLVGAPFESIGQVKAAGAVNEVGATHNRMWFQSQKSPAVPGAAESEDYFGYSVAGDSAPIIGVPNENGHGMVWGPWGYLGPLNPVQKGGFGDTVH